MIVTTTNQQAAQTLSVMINRVYSSEQIRSAVFYNDEIFGMFPVVQSQGDTAWRDKFETAGNASARRKPAEGAAPPAQSQTTKINLDLAYEWFDARVGYSRDLIAALAGSEARFYNVVEDEMQSAQNAIRDQITAEMIGAVRGGLLNMMNNAGTYAGVVRAGQPAWRSLVTAGVGALITAAMNAYYRQAVDKGAGQGMNINAIITTATQNENYNGLPGTVGTDPARRLTTDGSPPAIDLGYQWDGGSYMSIPITMLNDLLNTVWLFLDRSHISLIEHDAFQVLPQGQTAADTDLYLWWAGQLKCRDAFHQSIMTGVNV